MLKIQTIASGSKGNCTFIASENTRILVDIGLSLREVTSRLRASNIEPESIDAVLITHEHSDHIYGVTNFLKKFNCKLFLHKATIDVLKRFIDFADKSLEIFDDTSNSFPIGDLTVNFYPVPHDSAFCFGYSFKKDDCKISLATDLGTVSPALLKHMSDSQIVMLECNHDLLRLQNNIKYPAVLKRRISGSHGHLSNTASSLAIYELAKCGVQQIILAHISEQNNTPTLAYNFVRDFLAKKGLIEGQDISIDVAEQHKPSRPYQID